VRRERLGKERAAVPAATRHQIAGVGQRFDRFPHGVAADTEPRRQFPFWRQRFARLQDSEPDRLQQPTDGVFEGIPRSHRAKKCFACERNFGDGRHG
jgi:hypothetical protein